MTDTPSSPDILQKARHVLLSEGTMAAPAQDANRLTTEILPAMAKTKDIQSLLSSWQPVQSQTTINVLKAKILGKFRNIIVNVLDRTVQRQQKYNELTYQAVLELKAQIDELKRQQ